MAARTALIALAIAVFAPTAQTQQKDARTIRALSDQWQRDVAAQNVDAIVALHTPDAIVLMANSPAMKGAVAIRGGWSEMVKTPGLNLHWTPTRIDVASPKVATEYGTYRIVRYAQRQSDGRGQLRHDLAQGEGKMASGARRAGQLCGYPGAPGSGDGSVHDGGALSERAHVG
jgi:ketosteroid isomerase-like protein